MTDKGNNLTSTVVLQAFQTKHVYTEVIYSLKFSVLPNCGKTPPDTKLGEGSSSTYPIREPSRVAHAMSLLSSYPSKSSVVSCVIDFG